MADHVSDLFADPTAPITEMCEAARSGDPPLVEEKAERFTKHTRQLLKVNRR